MFDRTMRHFGFPVESIEADICTLDPGRLPAAVSVCLMDVDLAVPIREGLEVVLPRMVSGGIILVDDCDAGTNWRGARGGYQVVRRGARPTESATPTPGLGSSLPYAELAHDPRGGAHRNRAVRYVGEHDGVGAHDGAAPDPDAWTHYDVLAEPRARAHLDGSELLDRLVEDRALVVRERVAVVGDVHVAGEQHLRPDPDRGGRRQDVAAREAAAVSDLQPAVTERLQPRSGADEDSGAHGDAFLALKPQRQLQRAVLPERLEGTGAQRREGLGPDARAQPVELHGGATKGAITSVHAPKHAKRAHKLTAARRVSPVEVSRSPCHSNH
jgi:hypothetical protein